MKSIQQRIWKKSYRYDKRTWYGRRGCAI